MFRAVPVVVIFTSLLVAACGDDELRVRADARAGSPDAVAADATLVDAMAPDAEVPDAMPADDVVEQGGWTVSASVASPSAGMVQGTITFARIDGASTRGGGTCLTTYDGTACVVDADCPAPPTSGYSYCATAAGQTEPVCWIRPGSGLDYCYRSGVNAPGTYTTPVVAGTGTWMALGCMANEATPAGCGTTDPTQYVRALSLPLVVE